jgi:hypothetical protein
MVSAGLPGSECYVQMLAVELLRCSQADVLLPSRQHQRWCCCCDVARVSAHSTGRAWHGSLLAVRLSVTGGWYCVLHAAAVQWNLHDA